MKQRLWLGLAFLIALGALFLLLHRLPQITIYTNQSYAITRMAAFGVCLALLVWSWPTWNSAKISILLFAVLFAELIMYFRPVPLDPSGIGEAVHWYFPFWLNVNLLNIVLIPTAVGFLVYAYLHEEKTAYIVLAAIYLVLLASLFPFEQICRWGTYAAM